MALGGFGAGLANLGQIGRGLTQSVDEGTQALYNMLLLQQLRSQQQAGPAFFNALMQQQPGAFGGQPQGMPSYGLGPPGVGPTGAIGTAPVSPVQAQPLPPPQGLQLAGGVPGAPGGRPSWEQVAPLISRAESGGRTR